MKALRASLWLAGLAPAVLCGTQAAAQVDDTIVLNILRECARIDDPTARLACYDNNIRTAGAAPRASVPGEMQTPRGGSGAVVSGAASPATSGSSGFGSEDVRTPQRFEPRPGELASLTSVVTQVTPREPGVYTLTLQDGAQWQFTESVDRNYRVPRRGDTVTIDRASLGSYLMRFNDQTGIRVRRVR